jgi:LacI family transcriptional regulator
MNERRSGVPTIHDVARASGVSKSSVSNYFRRPEKLSEPTRDRIGRAIDELGFSPNDAARVLRTGRSPVVGYVAFELASARTPLIANAVAARLAENGIDLLLATDQGDLARERAYLDLFERQRVSGLIVSPLGDVEDRLEALRAKGMPSVLMTRHPRNAGQPAVSIDHRLGGRLAAEHLRATGRRRVAFVTDTVEVEQIAHRLEGAREVVPGMEIISCPDRTVSGGIAAAEALLALPVADRPDALFCVNDLVAIGIGHRIGAKLRVPEDIAIVGYDDIEFASTQAVPLTSVATPQRELGDAAAELLLEALGVRPAASALHVEFAPTLRVRASTVG